MGALSTTLIGVWRRPSLAASASIRGSADYTPASCPPVWLAGFEMTFHEAPGYS